MTRFRSRFRQCGDGLALGRLFHIAVVGRDGVDGRIKAALVENLQNSVAEIAEHFGLAVRKAILEQQFFPRVEAD